LASASLIQQDAAQAQLQVLEDRPQVAEVVHAALARGSPEALKRAVDAERVVLVDQSADDLSPGLGVQQSAVQLDDRSPCALIAQIDGSPKQLHPCRVLAGQPVYKVVLLFKRFASQVFERYIAHGVAAAALSDFPNRLARHVDTLKIGCCRGVTRLLQLIYGRISRPCRRQRLDTLQP